MQTTEKKSAEVIFMGISEMLGVDIRFQNTPTGPVSPLIDINNVISKLTALMVYVGWSVPSNISPPFSRVHADVEYWKKVFNQDDKDKPETSAPVEAPTEPPTEQPAEPETTEQPTEQPAPAEQPPQVEEPQSPATVGEPAKEA